MSKKLIVSEFGYSEFVDYALNTERVKGEDGISKSSETNRKQFTGTENFEEAVRLARYGWDAGIKEMELERDLIVSGQVEVIHSVVGASVDVGSYLSGNPECMFEYVDRVERDKPDLTIYTMLTYSGFNDQKDALQYAKKILNIIAKANVSYNVKLVGVFATHSNGVDNLEFIKIKDFEQNLVLNNLAFSFHPSFFRRLWFRYIETKEYRGSGYGIPFKQERFISEVKANNTDRNKVWILPIFQEQQCNWSEEQITKL